MIQFKFEISESCSGPQSEGASRELRLCLFKFEISKSSGRNGLPELNLRILNLSFSKLSFSKVENENFEIEFFETCFGNFEKWNCEMRIESSGHRLRICSLFALVLALTEGRCRRVDWFGFGISNGLLFLNLHRPRSRTGTVSSAFWLPAVVRSVTACGASLKHLPDRHEAPKMTRPKCTGFSGSEIGPGKFIHEAAILKFLRPLFEWFYGPRFAIGPGCLCDPWPRFTPFLTALFHGRQYMTPAAPETFSHHRQHRQRKHIRNRKSSLPRV